MPVYRRVLLGVCTLLLSSALAAPVVIGQGSSAALPVPRVIVGSIVDDNLTPLSGVTVTLQQSGKLVSTVQTDASGKFRIEGVSAGTYQLEARLKGFIAVTKTATMRAEATSLRVGLAMRRDGADDRSTPPSPAPSIETPIPANATGIVGIVTDSTGAVLPGVTVTVAGTGLQQPLVAHTTRTGGYRFLNVPIGTYNVTFELNGFKKLVRAGIQISNGLVARVDQKLEIGGLGETVTITAASPLVDTKRTATGGTFTGDIFLNTPTARDPWQMPVMTPGAMAGVNAGGSASGQRPAGGNVQWNLEGGNITDMSKNASPAYYNFDSFEEVQVPTGGTASYAHLIGNRFKFTGDTPVSTFAADVDTASYSNVRRFLTQGKLPPPDAVRIEEFVNYFRFDYPAPQRGRPVSITAEVGACPWAPDHRLVLIGAKAQAVEPAGARNLVFLLDVSGSMAPAPRLPLIKTAMRMFVDTLRPDDQVTIVTYAGTSGVALPTTAARDRERIHDVIASLNAGGSTNGAAGLMTAYRLAREAFIPGGVNRIMLATDGDFNVGVTGPLDLQHLIERERESGVFLSVLGVGDDNYKDSTMEMLADKENGHYAYLDSLSEARRVLIHEGGSTVETVAKDVKFQVEFNPAEVQAYKLIGYEDRLLHREDFNDDTKDGGELGAGHTVTVLYEVIPRGVPIDMSSATSERPAVDPLIYQPEAAPEPPVRSVTAAHRGEWLTVKVRYKAPDGDVSQLITQPVRPSDRVEHLPFASAVAEFALLLRSPRASDRAWDDLLTALHSARSVDASGERQDFVRVVELAADLRKLH